LSDIIENPCYMSMARQGMHNVYKDGDYKAPEEEPRYKNM